MGQAEEFSAAAFDVNSGQTGRVDISVTRWSTTAERDQLVKVLFEKGQDGLLRELQNVRPVGRIHSRARLDTSFAMRNSDGCPRADAKSSLLPIGR